jgi:hypothetical protein
MTTVEIEADIVDHRIDIRSEQLPANAKRAKLIVVYEEGAAEDAPVDILTLARAARAAFPCQPPDALAREMAELRGEWEREP